MKTYLFERAIQKNEWVGLRLVQAEAFLIIIKKKKKSRQASGIQEWPSHFKWRKNARIEKKGISQSTLRIMEC